MKQKFPGWYAREPEEIAALWDKAIFVPDANVLLHCLRHPAKVRDELLRIFGVLRESLWIPYQVALEFQRNRLDVEFGAQDTYSKLTSEYDAILGQAKEKLRQLRAHPMIDVEKESAALETFQADFRARMDTGSQAHPKMEIQSAVAKLTTLLDGRVGEKWKSEQLSALRKEGEDRYAKRVPPGYKDAKKDGENDKFGDLIIWKDMIAKAAETKRPIVFISDDVKEDWWWLHRGRKLGPRPELIEEFHDATGGQAFLIYEFANFLRIAADRHQEIKEGVDEVEKSLRGDERARNRQREVEDARQLSEKISDLEDERESIVQKLSGNPTVSGERSQEDRVTLRSRLEALNAELRELNGRLPLTAGAEGEAAG
jgi:hypothetical protein